LTAYRAGSTVSALQNDSPSPVTLDAGAHVVHPNGTTGKANEKKKKRRGLVKKTRKVMTTSSDTTASLEREGDEEGHGGGEHGRDEFSDAEAEAEVDFDEDGLMGMGINMGGAGINMGDMGPSSFHGGGDPAMSGMIGEMGMGMGMMSTMAAVMGGMGMVMSDGMRYGNGNGSVGSVGGARGRRAVRGSCPQPVEEIGESMEVDEESLRGRTSTRGSAAGSGVGTPACVGVDGKRAQNGILTNGVNAHPLIIDAAAVNGTVVGSSTRGLKEETMDELLGVGGGAGAGIHMGGGMNGVGNMGVGVVGMEMMGMGMQA